jgi:hypothetical protein|nr:MAG TPA: hypothetical protein [Caudoviricetes sp.]
MEQAMNLLIGNLTEGLFLLLLGFITYGCKAVIDFAKSKTQLIDDERQRSIIDNALNRLNNLVFGGVRAMEVSVASELRKAVKDGKVDRNELLKLKDVVRNEVLAGMNNDMKSAIELGVGEIDGYVNTLIENALADIKGKIEK